MYAQEQGCPRYRRHERGGAERGKEGGGNTNNFVDEATFLDMQVIDYQ